MKKVFGAIILVLWIIAVPCYLVYSVQAILSGNLQAEEIVLILVVCLILYFMLILICRIRGVFSSIFRGGWGTRVVSGHIRAKGMIACAVQLKNIFRKEVRFYKIAPLFPFFFINGY